MFLYRIRRKSDGRWYGSGGSYGTNAWKPKTGKFFTLPAIPKLVSHLEFHLDDIDVIRYELDESKYEVLDPKAFKKKGKR